MNARILAALALLLCLPLTAFAQDNSDERLQHGIARSLQSYNRLTIFDDVSAEVANGVITLSGKVTMPFKKNEIAKRLADIDGVNEVRNEITVLPGSIEDDDLRKRVARAIYGNPSFWNYAAMANPPIHIVVEGGRVTLTGVVHSDVDRMLARSLACGHGEISLTNTLRTDAEAR